MADFIQGLDPACFFIQKAEQAEQTTQIKKLFLIRKSDFDAWREAQKSENLFLESWLNYLDFSPEAGKILVIPGFNFNFNCKKELEKNAGETAYFLGILESVGKNFTALESLAAFYNQLPAGDYELEFLNLNLNSVELFQAYIGWGLQAYEFNRYKLDKDKNNLKRLVLDFESNSESNSEILNYLKSHYLIRDLINTPADHMGPSELAKAAEVTALKYQAKFECIKNTDLEKNFPAIHAVGRASDDPPCLIKLAWGKNKTYPKIILIGKGVCFDTGGLDLKDPEGMRWMKKDMGGAAHVLGLAELIMQAELKINLEVYIPAVENSIAGNAYRPGDVVLTRQGLNIEIGNTDAEGRVILSDALCLACEQKPDLIIDMATLTGAAKIALGPDLPALFSNNNNLVKAILDMGVLHEDPLWHMPLYQPYKNYLKSNIADFNNMSKSGYGGAITAALFLELFVSEEIPWCHIDLMAFNTSSRPAHPEGAEAMGLRALFYMLKKKYA